MTVLGCIADDFTGGTDVAAALRRSGLSVGLMFGVPDGSTSAPECDAIVIALKSRTVPAGDAVADTLLSWEWLRARGVPRLYLKYCSTFDSTDEGNIGPVTDALLAAMDEPTVLICPASPEHGRTVYRGHLFVGDQLLSDSSMRHHPLTPMTDSNLVGVLGRQTPGPVGLLDLSSVRGGAKVVAERLEELEASGVRHVVVDATEAADLTTVATAAVGMPLTTGGAGLAGALGQVLADERPEVSPGEDLLLPSGPGIVLAGSCSRATLNQVALATQSFPSYRLDPVATPDPDKLLGEALTWLRDNWETGPVLMYSSATPDDQARARAAMGPDTAAILETALGELACEAAGLGAARIVVAGGETSGAVVQALGVRSVVVLGEQDTGVPWCLPTGEPAVALLLKSGNFGSNDLLVRALRGADS
jgi:3-dehydrotetronate 4-kinase